MQRRGISRPKRPRSHRNFDPWEILLAMMERPVGGPGERGLLVGVILGVFAMVFIIVFSAVIALRLGR